MQWDQQLQHDVEQSLRGESGVRAEQIGVSVRNGVVELDGRVTSLYEKWAAERAALRVVNVKAIASEICVELPSSAVSTDEDVARTAVDHLGRNNAVPNTVKVKVTDGWVSLDGTVEWQYQKEEAEAAIRLLPGVKGISNEIFVKPSVRVAPVKANIEEALKRIALIDAGHITVTATESTVTLSGMVRSWVEREAAEKAALEAPGVTKVENHITFR